MNTAARLFSRLPSAFSVGKDVCSSSNIFIKSFFVPHLWPYMRSCSTETTYLLDNDNNFHEKKQKEKILKKLKTETVTDLMNRKIFAVIHMAGSQFKVTSNDVIMLRKRIEANCGDKIRIEKVLAVGGRCFTFVGQPLLKRELVNVEATVMEKTKGEKVIAFKKKKRKGYKRWKGHRQDLSVIKINNIDIHIDNL